jgi:hypothetical protein
LGAKRAEGSPGGGALGGKWVVFRGLVAVRGLPIGWVPTNLAAVLGGLAMIARTHHRVEDHTAPAVNQDIRRRTDARIDHYAHADISDINRRLAELEREWDIERCLETMAPTFTLLGMALGLTRARRWLFLPAMVQSFFLQHAVQGWCPPIAVLRRLGFRTMREIDEERMALKALRGDFKQVRRASGANSRGRKAAEAARK